jgi:rhodanese-related sulfurtransferase
MKSPMVFFLMKILTLVIICMTGHRSSVVAYRLKKRGFTEVHNLTFGMLGWLLSGGETVREKEE